MNTKKAWMDELANNPELRSKVVSTLLRLAATGAVGGAGLRLGMSAIRNADRGYEPPEPAKPMVVDIPYHVDRPVLGEPAVDMGGEHAVRRKPASDENFFPKWMPLRESLHKLLPTFRAVGGNPGASNVSDVPLTYAVAGPALAAGTFGGYSIADRILRAADRRRAATDLEEAKKEYNRSVLGRLVESRLPAKAAAAVPGTPDESRIKQALDRAYAAVKSAQSAQPNPAPVPQGWKAFLSAMFPGLSGAFGNTGANVNMAVLGSLGALGGYAGYNYARDESTAARIRDAMRRRDKQDAEGLPSPLIARLVPVPRPAGAG